MSGSEGDSLEPSEANQESNGLSLTVCRLCRQRKTRCDRRRPRCGHCIKAGVDCHFLPKQKKHGLRAGYVAELERRLDIVEQELQQVKENQLKAGIEVGSGLDSQGSSPWQATNRPPSRAARKFSFSDGLPAQVTSSTEVDITYELQHLSPAMMTTLCEVWFKEYQPWCPILDRRQIAASLRDVSSHPDQGMDITLKALLCLIVSHSSPAISLGYDGRRRLSQHLRSEVILEAMRISRNQSLQALLIIVIYHYGYGNLFEAWNLLSICKRMCVSLGLRKHLTSQTFDWQDEGSRMSWLTAAIESTSTLGASWDVELAKVGNPINALPSMVDADAIPASLVENLNLTVISLHPVHEFHRNNPSTSSTEAISEQCERLYANLNLFRQHSHMEGSITSYAFAPDGSISFDPNKVLTNIISNTAIITLYQPYTIAPTNHSTVSSPQSHQQQNPSITLHQTAIHRCLDAANEMSKIISTIADADIEFICPFLGSFIFTAARFSLVFSQLSVKTTINTTTNTTTNNASSYSSTSTPTSTHNSNNAPSDPKHTHHPSRSPGFDLLMHALNMCGRRWPLSRRLDIVLRAALVEESSSSSKPTHPHSRSRTNSSAAAATAGDQVPPAAAAAAVVLPHPLPREFYDLKLSGLDVDDVLAEWVEGMKSMVYVGSLNGPYA